MTGTRTHPLPRSGPAPFATTAKLVVRNGGGGRVVNVRRVSNVKLPVIPMGFEVDERIAPIVMLGRDPCKVL